MSIDEIVQMKDYLIVNPSFVKVDKYLSKFQTYQLSIALSIDEDISDSIFNLIRGELNQNISKEIIRCLISTTKFEYYDASKFEDISSIPFTEIRKISDFILGYSNGYKNIVANGMVVAMMQDISLFNVNPNRKSSSLLGQVYNVGNISGIEIWVDPYMKYNDNRIIMFNDVFVNIQDIDIKVNTQSQVAFSSRLMISHKMSLSVVDSKILFILDNASMPEFQKYRSLQRDIKINNILNESK